MSDTNWNSELEEAMKVHGEQWPESVVECIAEGAHGFSRTFDDGYGTHEGSAFTVWTEKRVYFPVVYDGAEWVESVARHPDGVPTTHIGSE